jgi:hypothetical protein
VPLFAVVVGSALALIRGMTGRAPNKAFRFLENVPVFSERACLGAIYGCPDSVVAEPWRWARERRVPLTTPSKVLRQEIARGGGGEVEAAGGRSLQPHHLGCVKLLQRRRAIRSVRPDQNRPRVAAPANRMESPSFAEDVASSGIRQMGLRRRRAGAHRSGVLHDTLRRARPTRRSVRQSAPVAG